MFRPITALCIACSLLAVVAKSESPTSAGNWPAWRGPQGDGTVESTDAPTKWSESEHVRWQVAIPGRGHGSPMVFGDRVYVPTAIADPQQQCVLCFDRQTGKPVWTAIVHEGGFANRSKRSANEKASLASSTVTTDGQRLFINFLNDSAVRTTALSMDGDILWQTPVSDYELHQGYGSSPLVHGSLVLVAADNKAGGAVVGLDRETGRIVWKHDRPKKPNYSSPVVVRIGDQDQLIMTGCDLVESLDPATGKVIWSVEGATTECVTSTPSDGRLVFSSGGYPKNHIAAYAADDNGSLVWENAMRSYVPSLLLHDGHLFAVLDEGIAVCLAAADGDVIWRKRLGGTFTSSPVLVGDRIYATDEDGKTHIYLASADGFQRIAENEIGTSVFATPAISGDLIFLRFAKYVDDQRQEFLACIEN
ncbi:outer membrane biogenesis protein BamB [Rubripirellula lacrimiformis]|uniref:Outer membrane biogenesis protein BamB n=1 Tax=Rubripirellula lacrimiformis TaxID=1930273 RepID=A0A517N7L1_9BACT|nr:PQQ-binding-like beta-propeller repeat protein [Rubripirellula lacrimiformis]QDT02978.1 outer membrane biogenesis protein BamB [Rubripirellula lacrimiformis]